MNSGIDGFLNEPFESKALSDKVLELIDRSVEKGAKDDMSDLELLDSSSLQSPGGKESDTEEVWEEDEIMELTELVSDEDEEALEFIDAVEIPGEEALAPLDLSEEEEPEVEDIAEEELSLDEETVDLEFEENGTDSKETDLLDEEISFEDESKGIQMEVSDNEAKKEVARTEKIDELELKEDLGFLDFNEEADGGISLEELSEGELGDLDEFASKEETEDESLEASKEISLDEISLDEDTVDLGVEDEDSKEIADIGEISLEETEEIHPEEKLRSEEEEVVELEMDMGDLEGEIAELEMVDEVEPDESKEEEVSLEEPTESASEIELSEPEKDLMEVSFDEQSSEESDIAVESGEELLIDEGTEPEEEVAELEMDLGDLEGEIAELEIVDEGGPEESKEEEALEDASLAETAEKAPEIELSEPQEELGVFLDEQSSEEPDTIVKSREEHLTDEGMEPEEEVMAFEEEDVGDLEGEIDQLETADEMEPEESVEEDLDYLSLKETAEEPMEFEPSDSPDEFMEESLGQSDSKGSGKPVRSEEEEDRKERVSLPEKTIMEGIEEIDIRGEFDGQADMWPQAKEGEISLEEIPLSSIATSQRHSFLELTLGDFGIDEHSSDELVSNKLTQNIHEMVEKITKSVALPIVEKVVREFALKRSEEIIKEEIERIKGMDIPQG